MVLRSRDVSPSSVSLRADLSSLSNIQLSVIFVSSKFALVISPIIITNTLIRIF